MSEPNDTPIACTLTSGDLRDRIDIIRRLTAGELVSHTLHTDRLQLIYGAQAWQTVEALVSAERECCAFLRFDLHRTDDGVELVISAPPGLEMEARWLFDQFLPDPMQSSGQPACGCSAGTCD